MPPSVQEYWSGLEPHFRHFSPEEQRAAVAIYRELAKGAAITHEALSLALGTSMAEGRALLARDPIKSALYADVNGRILGFGGLAIPRMHHRFVVGDRLLYTWCAWDSLFIPEILGMSADVTSADPESGAVVHLRVTPDEIQSSEPQDPLVSFLVPEPRLFGTSAANIMRKFCHFVFFFASRDSGNRWVEKHPGTFLYSLDEAFALAKLLNARNFGRELERRAPHRASSGR